jgi:hypothetical protein
MAANQATERNLFNNDHPAGKGDKERSPGWRGNYQEIDFHRDQPDGFSRRGNKQVKVYAPGRRAVFIHSQGGEGSPVPATL